MNQLNESDFEYFLTSRGEGRHVCPLCSGDRKKKNQRTLDVDQVSDGLVYKCWHCEASGKVKDNPFDDFDIDPPPKVQASSVPKQNDSLVADNFLRLRGIDPDRIRHLNVVGVPTTFTTLVMCQLLALLIKISQRSSGARLRASILSRTDQPSTYGT